MSSYRVHFGYPFQHTRSAQCGNAADKIPMATAGIYAETQFLRIAAPFPIDKMKSIIRKATVSSDTTEERC